VFRVLNSKYKRAKNQSENLKIKKDQSVSNVVYSIVLQAQHMELSTMRYLRDFYFLKSKELNSHL